MEIAEIKVSYSTNKPDKIKLTTCHEVYKFILSKWDIDLIEFQEECKVILLNRANCVLGIYNLSKGGISGTVVDNRVILSVALKCNASSIILVHNHPSGNMKPSEADNKITEKLKNACELLDIQLLDHLIICKYEYYSFAKNENIINHTFS
ncbi:DNA repair protein RadC [Flavobacterium columnare ATCC 49512]|uniref:DNA repair protein RadC n=1 Tax=Flavobacterium columnare (strain ATCC 49512 / CIP 103533 / TG 44/87) TaxID=1041826 RepID=G8X7Y5_FLACA|nr:JAB domain-containing protein [Flavobacterium columnare]AEW87099.1 DNA repair protein RadC [Flavobacterium columnare ATCC 49512]